MHFSVNRVVTSHTEFVAVEVQRLNWDQTLLTAYLSYYSLITVYCMGGFTRMFLSKASDRNTTAV